MTTVTPRLGGMNITSAEYFWPAVFDYIDVLVKLPAQGMNDNGPWIPFVFTAGEMILQSGDVISENWGRRADSPWKNIYQTVHLRSQQQSPGSFEGGQKGWIQAGGFKTPAYTFCSAKEKIKTSLLACQTLCKPLSGFPVSPVPFRWQLCPEKSWYKESQKVSEH